MVGTSVANYKKKTKKKKTKTKQQPQPCGKNPKGTKILIISFIPLSLNL